MLVCLLTISAFFVPQLSRADDAEIERLVQQFYYNVSNGHSSSAIAFLTDPILSERGDHLRNNPNYSNFLRKMHANATMRVTSIVTIDEGTKTVDVEISRKDEINPEKLRYVVKKEQNRWKISDEVRP